MGNVFINSLKEIEEKPIQTGAIIYTVVYSLTFVIFKFSQACIKKMCIKNINDMENGENVEVNLEYPKIKPVIPPRKIDLIPADQLMMLHKQKELHEKSIRQHNDKKNVMKKILDANKAGKKKIKVKKKELNRELKHDLRRVGYIVRKPSGCGVFIKKSIRVIEWGLNTGLNIMQELKSFEIPEVNFD